MDAALISALFAGLAGLVGSVAAALSTRQKRVQRDVDALDIEMTVLQRQLEVAVRYIHDLRLELSMHGLSVPDMPDDLTRRRERRELHTGQEGTTDA